MTMSPLWFRACVPVYALWMLACGSDTNETGGAGGTGGGVTVAGVLSTLTTTVGDPSPKFASDVSDYTLDVPLLTTWLEVVVTAPAGTTVTVEGAPVVNGHSARIELAAGSTKLAVVASAPGGKTTYSLEVRRGVGVVAYLKSLASHAGAECGSAIGASGNTVALGCPRDGVTAAGPERGAVFLYSLGKDGWKFDQAVTAATGADADRFGTSLALDGDTLVVGAPNRAQNQGAAYVFTRDATGTWAQVKQLKGSNSAPLDIFGSSVALAGDILAVGAPGEDGGSGGVNGPVTETAAGSGAVYVFARKDGVFTEEAYLKADAPAATDLFGSGVALFGERLAVSAPYQDTTAIDSGAVYLYERAAAVWAFTTRVKHPSPTASDAFGTSLSLGADVLAVGAPGDDAASANPANNDAFDSGAVLVYERGADGSWPFASFIKSPTATPGDQFGSTVSYASGLLASGSPREDGSGTGLNPAIDEATASAGAVHTFRRTPTGWVFDAYLKASTAKEGARFGSTLSFGGFGLAVGASYDNSDADGVDGDSSDTSAPSAGAAYMVR